jgi:hypothetical protein
MSNCKKISTKFSDGLSTESLNSKILSTELSAEVSTKFRNFVRECVSKCNLCQPENERFGRNSLSKSETVSKRTDLKTNFKNLSKNSALSKFKTLNESKNLSKSKPINPKFQNSLKQPDPVAPEILSCHQNSQLESFLKTQLCFKWREKYGL